MSIQDQQFAIVTNHSETMAFKFISDRVDGGAVAIDPRGEETAFCASEMIDIVAADNQQYAAEIQDWQECAEYHQRMVGG